MHGWKSKEKFKSAPCESLKEFLIKHKINFIEEFESPVIGRQFKIDIAFPDKKIGIEVNGNQHYDSLGNLKPYYNERHNLIENEGWVLYEIHYSCCYKEDIIIPIINKIIESEIKLNFDYLHYTPKSKLKKLCKNCQCEIYKYATYCKNCVPRLSKNKIIWPPDEKLKELVWQKSMLRLSKELGVSSTSIKKRCKKKNITTPTHGYWEKKYHNKI